MIGAEMSFSFKILKAVKQLSSNLKGVSLLRRLYRGFEILEKSLINLL